ncbi:MAG: hypothetical protein AAGG11_20820 [Pseudomonadota bacterium]
MTALPCPPLKEGNIVLAATLVLIRNGPEGVELYLTERPGRVDFPSLHVFPGGKVSAADDALARRPDYSFIDPAFSAVDVDALLGERHAMRYWLACVREAYEEVGVIFAQRDGRPLGRAEQLALAHFRDDVADDSLSLAAFCTTQGLSLDLGALHYFSHWFTPPTAPRRFDTRFFLAELPPAQQADAHDYEVVSASWATPEAALQRAASGEWKMISPTLESLRSLRGLRSCEAVFAHVAARRHLPDELSATLKSEGMAEFGHAVPRA